ncbi:MAG: hypothetical protein J6R32_10930 [Bacteroidales bacterium]|nr:hypothetical protein [Bacteroidales bacterium]
MTLEQIKSAVAGYVAASKQAGTWEVSNNNIAGLIDKIAKTITIDGLFADKLPQLDGEELPLGKTIEEYYTDLAQVVDYNDRADQNSPHYPTYQDNTYNYTLGRKVVQTTLKYNEYERAFNSEAEFNTIVNMVIKRLYDTYAVFKYNTKKQILANIIAKATDEPEVAAKLVEVLPMPVDATTGEAFIESVKASVEEAQFVSEGHSLNTGATIGAAEGLLLIVKKGVKPALEVQVQAGAFQLDKLAVPAEIVVVDDFGSAGSEFYAILMDRRMARLHPTYTAVREHMNAAGDWISYFLHTENTAFISKNTYVKVYSSVEL